mgnify:CR=1 FL=1
MELSTMPWVSVRVFELSEICVAIASAVPLEVVSLDQ